MAGGMGWKGKAVRNVDGRQGTIMREGAGFLHVALFIIADDGTTDLVQLNSDGRDTGAKGWAWQFREAMPEDSAGDAWSWLGDHNVEPVPASILTPRILATS